MITQPRPFHLAFLLFSACAADLPEPGSGGDAGKADEFVPSTGYPGLDASGQCFRLEADLSTRDGQWGLCRLSYTVLRPSYRLADRGMCTDLLVTSRTAYVHDGSDWYQDWRGCFWDIDGQPNVKAPHLGEVVRRCAGDDGSDQGSRGAVLGSITTYLSTPGDSGLHSLRSDCSSRLSDARATWEALDAEYRALEQKLRDIPRDLVLNTLGSLFRTYLDASGARGELKLAAEVVFKLAIEDARGTRDLSAVLRDDLIKRSLVEVFTEELEAAIPQRALSGDWRTELIGFLAKSLAGETLKQAQAAVDGRSAGSDPGAVLLSFADSAADVLIGMASKVGDKFLLGGVIETELHLLKAEVKVLVAAIPNALANAEASAACDRYTDAFNNDRTRYMGITLECLAQATRENSPLADLVRERRIEDCPRTCAATCDADGWCRQP